MNCIAPDTTPSKTSFASLPQELLDATARLTPAQIDQLWKLYIPQGFQPPVEELGKAVLFLASDPSSSITGTTLHVDGGTSASMGFLRWPHGGGWLPTAWGDAAATLFPDNGS